MSHVFNALKNSQGKKKKTAARKKKKKTRSKKKGKKKTPSKEKKRKKEKKLAATFPMCTKDFVNSWFELIFKNEIPNRFSLF